MLCLWFFDRYVKINLNCKKLTSVVLGYCMTKKMILGFIVYSLLSTITRAAEPGKSIEIFKIKYNSEAIESIYRITKNGQELLEKSEIKEMNFVRIQTVEPADGEVKVTEPYEKGVYQLFLLNRSLKDAIMEEIKQELNELNDTGMITQHIIESNRGIGFSLIIVKDLHSNTGKVRFFTRTIPDLKNKLEAFLDKKITDLNNSEPLPLKSESKAPNSSLKGPVLGLTVVMIVALSVLGTIVYFKSPNTPLPYILQLPAIMVMKIVPESIHSAIKGRFGAQSNVYSGV